MIVHRTQVCAESFYFSFGGGQILIQTFGTERQGSNLLFQRGDLVTVTVAAAPEVVDLLGQLEQGRVQELRRLGKLKM